MRASRERAVAVGGSSVCAAVSLLGSFAVGVERSRWAGVTRTFVPLAAALPLVVCADAQRILEVYGVPVWSFERAEQPTGAAWQPSWGSVNRGALYELRSGFGVQRGVGGLFQDANADPYRRVVISAGLHFSPQGILKAAAPRTEQGRWGCGFVL